MENLPAATQLLKTLMEMPDSSWDEAVNEDSGVNHITGFRRINIEGKASTHIQMKLVETFPEVTPDQFWKMATDTEKRGQWDERFANMEKLGDGENNGTILYFIGKKPPIPMVSARETLVNVWKDETSLGEGKRALITTSVERDDKPITDAYVRLNAEVIATIVEANPDGGCLVNEYRSIDVGGSMIGMVIDKMSKMGPKKNFEGWCRGIEGKVWE